MGAGFALAVGFARLPDRSLLEECCDKLAPPELAPLKKITPDFPVEREMQALHQTSLG